MIRATVMNMKLVIPAEKRSVSYKVILAGNKMRIGDEIDRWRLFDLGTDTVTFVDDVARSYRVVSGTELVRAALDSVRVPVPPSFAPAQVLTPGGTTRISGYSARPLVIRMGAYEREMWISGEVPVPGRFLALQLASDASAGPLSGVMRNVLPTLLEQQGFVVLERSRLPLETTTMSMERSLVSVEQEQVPQAWVSIPAGYADLDPPRPRGSPSSRPPASSRGPDRNAREAESRSSATDRKAP